MADKEKQKTAAPSDAPQTIGERIRLRRLECGLTQAQLAEMLNLANKATISQYENGLRSINGEMILAIADALHTSPDYLLRGDRPEDSFLYELWRTSEQVKTCMGRKCILHHINLIRKMEEDLELTDNSDSDADG